MTGAVGVNEAARRSDLSHDNVTGLGMGAGEGILRLIINSSFKNGFCIYQGRIFISFSQYICIAFQPNYKTTSYNYLVNG